jgi:ParB-like chromosome segregation protein Spo0J
VVKKSNKGAGHPPEKSDPGESKPKEEGDERERVVKKKSGRGSRGGEDANDAPPGSPTAVLGREVQWRDPKLLKPTYAKAVREHTKEELDDLRASISEERIRTPLIITPGGDVIDGNGRARIAKELGIAKVPCVVLEGVTEEEAWTLATKLNTDRRHLTRDEKRKAIADALNRDESVSDRAIAKRTHSSHVTVGKIRKDLEATGKLDQSNDRFDEHGVARPASANQKKKTKAVEKDAKRQAQTNSPSGSDEPAEVAAPPAPADGTADSNDTPKPAAASAAAVLTELAVDVKTVEPKVQRLIDLIRAGGPEKPHRPDVAAIADAFAQFAKNLNGAFKSAK